MASIAAFRGANRVRADARRYDRQLSLLGTGVAAIAAKSFADEAQPTEIEAKVAKESGSLVIPIDIDRANAELVQTTAFPDPLPNRRQLDLRVNGLSVKLVSAFFTEAKNGKPHFGAAEFLTRGCMYNGKTVRVIGYIDDPVSYHGGLMIFVQT
jgi:hypothetical protein